MMLLKCCIQNVSKFGKPSSGHRTRKGQFPLHSQRRAMPKNVHTTIQCTHFTYQQSYEQKASSQASAVLNIKNFQMYKLGLEKAEEPEIKLPTFAESQRRQGDSRKISTVSLTMLKPLAVWIITNCGKLLKRRKYQIVLPVS